jgi:hypothetical protein
LTRQALDRDLGMKIDFVKKIAKCDVAR